MLQRKFKAFHTFLCLAALLLLAPALSAQVAVSGHLVDAGGSAIPNSYVRFQLTGCGGNIPRVNGSFTLVKSYKDFVPDPSTGLISGTLFANDTITCGSTPSSTKWIVTFTANNIAVPGSVCYFIPSSPFNLDTATPVSCK